MFESIPLPEGSVVTITDSGSRVLARSLDPERFIGKVIEVSPLPPSEVARAIVRAGIDGVPRFYGNATIERGPWLLSVGIPTSVAAARLAPLWWRNFTIVTASIAGVLLLSLSFSHQLSRALDGLRLNAQRIAAGDLSPPVRGPVANLELAELQDGFITMAGNLRKRMRRSTSRSNRNGKSARRCSRCSGRSSARSGSRPSASWCRVWPTN